MKPNLISKYLAPVLITIIIAVFIYNFVKNGSIEHPGKTSYQNYCANCHGDKGEGIKGLVPPLMEADYARVHFDSLPCWLKNGMNHPIMVNGKVYDQPMYPFEADEIQMANVINYINKKFLKTDRKVNSAWVKEKLESCN